MARYLELHIQLRHTEVWRRVRILRSYSLGDLHDLIQAAFGWKNSHLYVFRKGKKERARSPYLEDFAGGVPEADDVEIAELLQKKGSRCEYEYDFGDGWVHDIVVECWRDGTGDHPWLLDGALAGPPEDCGGVPGYERLLEFCRTGVDPHGEDPEFMREWIGEWSPDGFQSPASDPIDPDKVEEAALALLCLTLHDESRAWKSLDLDLMNRMHERGWIANPKGKAKSVLITPKGLQRSRQFALKYFGRDPS